MLMPPHIRATFMPGPPLAQLGKIVSHKRRNHWTPMTQYLSHFEEKKEKTEEAPIKVQSGKKEKIIAKLEEHKSKIAPLVTEYQSVQKESGGEYKGMNCYHTLFVGRLAYEVTERKLLREMEAFGPVKDLILVKKKTAEGERSAGYAFVEYEHEDDMKRAYRAADGMRIEGRPIVVDVERGHTVPSWLPRRLGGGLGGTRLGGREVNMNRPGRFDPSKADMAGPSRGLGRGSSQEHGGTGRGGSCQPPYADRGGRGRGGFRDGDRLGHRQWDDRKRPRSPDRFGGGDAYRRRYS